MPNVHVLCALREAKCTYCILYLCRIPLKSGEGNISKNAPAPLVAQEQVQNGGKTQRLSAVAESAASITN